MDLASPILHRPQPAVNRHRPPAPHHHQRWISRSLRHPPLCGGRHPPIIRRSPHRHRLLSRAPDMVGFDTRDSSYEDALSRLSSLITRRTRAEAANNGDCFDHMLDYLKMLELEEPIARLSVIHVAGTKGKGSTCTFTESILRCCGFRTALFTSPHLVDVRERFRIDGVEISKEKFLEYFWWCWNRLQEKTNNDVPMPSYFRFLALLGFKIFSEEQVDVAILEVGLGGRFDATNVVQAPIVCGISSLGYDHMEILGFTLGEIAREKAGIFKKGVPAYTVPQPQEAMAVLETQASQLGIPLHVALPLDMGLLKTQKLGLDGEHQYINAGLAVALSQTWLKKTGNTDVYLDDNAVLPEQFVKGLMMAHLQGRAQVVHDPHVKMYSPTNGLGGLVYYLDGAHSPESLEVCARWFSHVVKKEAQQSDHLEELHHDCQSARQILLFNCLSVRDPQLLLPRLINTCGSHGVHFHKAIFVPNQSVFNKVGSHASLPTNDPQLIDLSWQLSLQRQYENLRGESGVDNDKIMDPHESRKFADLSNTENFASSSVFPSLPFAIKWLRDTVQHNRSIHFQVLVTGSMHLVGDVLRLIKK